MKNLFLQLVRLGIGVTSENLLPNNIDWLGLQVLAEEQGLGAIVLDGIERLPDTQRPPQDELFEWIGEALQEEATFSLQSQVAKDVALIFHQNGIKTYILKGTVVSECYPKPSHRESVDVDCYLLPENGNFDAWRLGNDLMKAKGFRVDTDFYKNSSFDISGVHIENHQYFTPFRGNKRLAALEQFLQVLIKQGNSDVFEGTYLYRPPVLVTALFLIEHAYSHFLHEGLTWRHVLDWMMFSTKHMKEINWADFETLIDKYGFRKFYDSYLRLGKYLYGEMDEDDLNKVDKKMLTDIWAPLDVHETVRGLRGKLALAGNTWRAKWKYQCFTDIFWWQALWIQVRGFLFEKTPTLN